MEVLQANNIQATELKSDPITTGSFDLSPKGLPSTDVSVLSQSYEKIFPINSVVGNQTQTPCEFIIPESQQYLDLGNCYIVVSGSIKKKGGGAIPAGAQIAPCNNFGHAIWSSLEVFVNGISITRNTSNYGHISNILRMFGTNEELKSTRYLTELYKPDTGEPNTFSDTNTGFAYRKAIAKESKTFEVITKLNQGLFISGKYLRPSSTLKVRLMRSSPETSIDAAPATATAPFTSVEFQIEECYMIIKRLVVNPTIQEGQDNLLAREKLLYSYVDTHMLSYSISNGTQVHQSEILQLGELPIMVCVCLQKSTTYHGDFHKSTYCYTPEGLKSLTLTCDGEDLAYKEIEIDLDKQKYMWPYIQSFMGLSAYSDSHGITPQQFVQNSFVVVLNLLNGSRFNRFQLTRSGALRLELKFKESLSENVNVLVLLQNNRILGIDRNNSIYLQ